MGITFIGTNNFWTHFFFYTHTLLWTRIFLTKFLRSNLLRHQIFVRTKKSWPKFLLTKNLFGPLIFGTINFLGHKICGRNISFCIQNFLHTTFCLPIFFVNPSRKKWAQDTQFANRVQQMLTAEVVYSSRRRSIWELRPGAGQRTTGRWKDWVQDKTAQKSTKQSQTTPI